MTFFHQLKWSEILGPEELLDQTSVTNLSSDDLQNFSGLDLSLCVAILQSCYITILHYLSQGLDQQTWGP